MMQGPTLPTPQGDVTLCRLVEPGDMHAWRLDDGMGDFDRFRSFFPDMSKLAAQAARPGADLCVALHGDAVVGYVLLRPAPADERWGELSSPPLFELFIEISRNWRGGHMGKPMLKWVIEQPENDDRVVYLVGYSWTWDVDATGKSLQEYRQGLKNLVEFLGFKEYPTNEPNVALRPENLFMARIGVHVEADRPRKRRFTNLLFGIRDDDY